MDLQSQFPIPSPEKLRPKFIDCLQISVMPGLVFPRPPRLSAAFWIVLLLR